MKRFDTWIVAIGISSVVISSVAAGADVKIANGKLEVTWHENGTFSVVDLATKREFVKDATLFCKGPAEVFKRDPSISEIQAITIHGPNGSEVVLALIGGSPWLLIRGSMTNGNDQPKVIDKLDVARLPIDWGLGPERTKLFGTGGLSDWSKPAGSYMWQAVADPITRNGVVVGWTTSERGSGTLHPKLEDGKPEIVPKIEYGRLRLKPKQEIQLERLVIGYFDDARRGLEDYANLIGTTRGIERRKEDDPFVSRSGREHLPPQPCGYCTWYHAGASSAAKISPLAEFAAKELKPFGFSVVQIDDGWQAGEKLNGPRKDFTQVREKGPYPDGMQPTAAAISKLGLTPGLWFMPFAGTAKDPAFAEHQDWFVKREDGTPFDTKWGGTCLDMTLPAAQEYVRGNVHRITHDWGYKYLKMDGLWTGTATDIQYVNDTYKDDKLGNAVLSNPDKTNIEAFRDGLKLIRKAAGDDVFLLGCCAPQNMRSYGGAFGLLDAMRIGPDNGATPAGLLRGPRYGTRNYFLHGRVWWNDPDPVYVRPSLTRAQAELSVSWAGVSGQLTICSDDLEKLPPERLDLLKRVMPAHGLTARPVDLFERDLPREWVVSKSGDDRIIVGLFNWDQESIEIEETVARFGLKPDASYDVYDFWSHKLEHIRSGEKLKWKLAALGKENAGKDATARDATGEPPHCCAVLSICKSAEVPRVISTSRHVTQGLMDLKRELLGSKTKALVGESSVVGGDPYEIRIVLPKDMKPKEATVAKDDVDAGVKVFLAQQQNLVLLRIESPTSRDVNWSFNFEE